jgi:uncharacterized protein YyaL (SSP411 family)
MANIEWQDFEPHALEVARAQDRPIFMVIVASWCPHSRELLATTMQDPEVQTLVDAGFVPVQVDAERRPDVNTRYGSGGWPTIAYVTPDGELITHDRFMTAPALAARLRKVAEHYRLHRGEIQQGLRGLLNQKSERDPHERHGKLTMAMVDDVVEAIYEKFDHRHGGFGEGAKFPHPEAVDFALVCIVKKQDAKMREVATTTLRRMMEAAIWDRIDGGFFRFSSSPDWQSPHLEKVLEPNAQILRNYLEAYQVFGDESYRQVAEGIIRWMLSMQLSPKTGAFFGSTYADPDYYSQSAEERRAGTPPRRDETIYANWNALTISALLKASATLGRPDLREAAMRALGFLLENLYHPSDGVYHYWDGTYHLMGLLADQAYVIRALVDASQHTGDSDLLLPAEVIAELAIKRQRAPGGGFYDIRQETGYTGSMRRRNRSILENSVMAEALVRLSYLSRRREFYDEAIAALEAFTTDYKEYGYYVAGYARAVDLVFYEPLMVTIVGDRDSEAADALRRAALSLYVPSRIVQMLDPRHDPVLLARSGYEVKDRPVVYVSVGKTTKAVVEKPPDLLAKIAELEAERRR